MHLENCSNLGQLGRYGLGEKRNGSKYLLHCFPTKYFKYTCMIQWAFSTRMYPALISLMVYEAALTYIVGGLWL